MCQGHDQVVLCTRYHAWCEWVTLSQSVPVLCQGWTSPSSQAAQETRIYLHPGFSCAVSQQDPRTFPAQYTSAGKADVHPRNTLALQQWCATLLCVLGSTGWGDPSSVHELSHPFSLKDDSHRLWGESCQISCSPQPQKARSPESNLKPYWGFHWSLFGNKLPLSRCVIDCTLETQPLVGAARSFWLAWLLVLWNLALRKCVKS